MAAIKAPKEKKAVCRKCRRLEREVERLERELIAARLAALTATHDAKQASIDDSLAFLPEPEKVDEFARLDKQWQRTEKLRPDRQKEVVIVGLTASQPEPAMFAADDEPRRTWLSPDDPRGFNAFSNHRTFMESAPAAPVAARSERPSGIVKRLQAAVSQMSRYEQVVSFVAVFGLPVALIVGFAVLR